MISNLLQVIHGRVCAVFFFYVKFLFLSLYSRTFSSFLPHTRFHSLTRYFSFNSCNIETLLLFWSKHNLELLAGFGCPLNLDVSFSVVKNTSEQIVKSIKSTALLFKSSTELEMLRTWGLFPTSPCAHAAVWEMWAEPSSIFIVGYCLEIKFGLIAKQSRLLCFGQHRRLASLYVQMSSPLLLTQVIKSEVRLLFVLSLLIRCRVSASESSQEKPVVISVMCFLHVKIMSCRVWSQRGETVVIVLLGLFVWCLVGSRTGGTVGSEGILGSF